ncbi:MAG: hypothetical protein DDT28_00952 [Dehalococcoidia bacterium]|nr:hypothetical protein [Chloroflexota bacterium]
MTDGGVSLNLDNVLEPVAMFWYQEGDYVILIQHQPRREIILTKAGRAIWELVTNDNLTAAEIIERLQHRYSEEVIMANLETMLNMELIRTKRSSLWQEE